MGPGPRQQWSWRGAARAEALECLRAVEGKQLHKRPPSGLGPPLGGVPTWRLRLAGGRKGEQDRGCGWEWGRGVALGLCQWSACGSGGVAGRAKAATSRQDFSPPHTDQGLSSLPNDNQKFSKIPSRVCPFSGGKMYTFCDLPRTEQQHFLQRWRCSVPEHANQGWCTLPPLHCAGM